MNGYTKNPTYTASVKEWDTVVLNKDIRNKDLKIRVGTKCRVINSPLQVASDLYIDITDIEGVNSSLNVGVSYGDKNKVEGLVFKVERKDFGVVYNVKRHEELLIPSVNIEGLDFITVEKLALKRNGDMGYYAIQDLIDNIEDNFKVWVEQNQKTRAVTEDDCVGEGLTDVFTDEFLVKFYEKKKTIESKFSEKTGIYYNFLGGTVDNS